VDGKVVKLTLIPKTLLDIPASILKLEGKGNKYQYLRKSRKVEMLAEDMADILLEIIMKTRAKIHLDTMGLMDKCRKVGFGRTPTLVGQEISISTLDLGKGHISDCQHCLKVANLVADRISQISPRMFPIRVILHIGSSSQIRDNILHNMAQVELRITHSAKELLKVTLGTKGYTHNQKIYRI
jgi:hypothetical protein